MKLPPLVFGDILCRCLSSPTAGIHELESIPAMSGKIHRYKRKIKFETPQDKNKNSWMEKWSDLTSFLG